MCFILLLPPKGVIFIFTLLSRHWLPLWYLVWYLATLPFCVETEQSRTRHTGPVESNPTPPFVLPAHRDPVLVRMRLNEIQIKLIAESRGLAASTRSDASSRNRRLRGDIRDPSPLTPSRMHRARTLNSLAGRGQVSNLPLRDVQVLALNPSLGCFWKGFLRPRVLSLSKGSKGNFPTNSLLYGFNRATHKEMEPISRLPIITALPNRISC